jgi:hypothetical protein
MNSEVPQELPDVAAWHAQYLRIIAFPVESPLSIQQTWWRDVAGYESETVTRKTQKREESGTYEGCGLILEVDPFRVKWTVSPHVDPENLPDQLPTLGPLTARRDWLIALMRRWLQTAPSIKRLAFAGSLLQFVDCREDGYLLLDRYLRHTTVDPSTSDFMYRVNRRKQSQTGITGLEINRLCTWACATFSVGIRAHSGLTGETADIRIQEDRNACMLEFDVNTVPESSGPELPGERLADVLVELIDYCTEVAAVGDI